MDLYIAHGRTYVRTKVRIILIVPYDWLHEIGVQSA